MSSAMDGEWVPAFILANVSVRQPIQNDYYALVPHEDERIRALRRKEKEFDKLLSSFTDEFGVARRPGLIIVRAGVVPSILNIEAVAGFRDAIAMAFVCKSRALRQIYTHPRGLQFSSWFEFYPWITSVKYDGLIGMTPAMHGWHRAEKFQGQSTPGLPHVELDVKDADESLLEALLGFWRRRFVTHEKDWRSVALFRSLNMAFAAAQVPSGPDLTHYALGRAVGLWISAFEILAHSGKNGGSGYKNVYDLLHKVHWQTERCRETTYQAYSGRNKTATNNLCCWIYGELFRARNDFLHGNPVALDRLVVNASDRSLHDFAAPLFRLALTGFLTIQLFSPCVPSSRLDEFLKFHQWERDVLMDQCLMERAVSKVLDPAEMG